MLDLLTHFAPFWLGGALVSLVHGWLFARGPRRAALVWVGVLGAIGSAALIAPEFARSIPRAKSPKEILRLIQFNTWDETLDPNLTVAWIARQRPDVVILEETEPTVEAALRARGFLESPGFGHVAIFSRETPVIRPAPLAPAEWSRMPPFARATLGSRSARYTLIAVHMPEPVYKAAGPQRRMLATFLNRYDTRDLIIAGDFNLTPWSFALRTFGTSLALCRVDRAAFSWPARLSVGRFQIGALPFLPLDHVYVGSSWRVVSVNQGPALGSDHRPLVVVLSADHAAGS